jgi:hypothetical protein
VVGIASPTHRGTVPLAAAGGTPWERGKAEMAAAAEAADVEADGAVAVEDVGHSRWRTAFAVGRRVVRGCSRSCPNPVGSLQPGSSTPCSGLVRPATLIAYISPTRHRPMRPGDPTSPGYWRLTVLGDRARSFVDTLRAVHTAVVAVRHLPCQSLGHLGTPPAPDPTRKLDAPSARWEAWRTRPGFRRRLE